MTIAAMTAEIRENNIAKGWRSASGGPGDNTLGDYIALLHTEVAEAVEAYRDHRLADATTPACGRAASGEEPCPEHGPSKPEGVGSELADVLIRLLDTGDVFGFEVSDPDFELGDIADLYPMLSDPGLPELVTFADDMAWLHRRIDQMWTDTTHAPAWALRALVTVARKHGIDMEREYARKIAYNRSRAFRHGGRALSETNA
jgi:NTP pyrophosphatase (non-canonical NTP hydrolase)